MTQSPAIAPALRAGIGLRAPHHGAMMADRPPVGFLEIHPENALVEGATRDTILTLRPDYPVSLHAVGLSLGSAEGVDARHLGRIAALAAEVEPLLISDHLSWSVIGGAYLNDLLPLPMTEEALDLVARNVDCVQHVLRRRLLVENPSRYLAYTHDTIAEPDFLAALATRTGCALLLDVNNVAVSAHNLGFDATVWLDALPRDVVAQIHLAGHHRADADGETVLIDDHGSAVAPVAWDLYRHAIARFGRVPTLIERDSAIPPLAELCAEAAMADRIAAGATRDRHARAA